MTGSGKTGLTTVVIEEAIDAGIPTLVIDAKGALPGVFVELVVGRKFAVPISRAVRQKNWPTRCCSLRTPAVGVRSRWRVQLACQG